MKFATLVMASILSSPAFAAQPAQKYDCTLAAGQDRPFLRIRLTSEQPLPTLAANGSNEASLRGEAIIDTRGMGLGEVIPVVIDAKCPAVAPYKHRCFIKVTGTGFELAGSFLKPTSIDVHPAGYIAIFDATYSGDQGQADLQCTY